MRLPTLILVTSALFFLQSCRSSRTAVKTKNEDTKTVSTAKSNIPARVINTKNISPDVVVDFAVTLIGVKYKYGSAVKEQGFDCSGFITYVFNHFDIAVPRSSVDFTNAGTNVPLERSRKGDLILFTGSDNSTHIVGHMGIITQNNNGKVKFIHSASGNGRGVMISEMSNYFVAHFVKVIRIFK